jgi:hypothetical protein
MATANAGVFGGALGGGALLVPGAGVLLQDVCLDWRNKGSCWYIGKSLLIHR